MRCCKFDNALLCEEERTARQHDDPIGALPGDCKECAIQLAGTPYLDELKLRLDRPCPDLSLAQ